jgi:hypothetical protein
MLLGLKGRRKLSRSASALDLTDESGGGILSDQVPDFYS